LVVALTSAKPSQSKFSKFSRQYPERLFFGLDSR
jgi:deoxyxylulose-5-phosphate synthase